MWQWTENIDLGYNLNYKPSHLGYNLYYNGTLYMIVYLKYDDLIRLVTLLNTNYIPNSTDI